MAVREKVAFKEVPAIDRAIVAAGQDLQSKGRLLVRYSGTEKLARVMVEGDDPKRIEHIAKNLISLIQTHLGV